MPNLSEHFTLEELTHTDTGLPNVVDPAEMKRLQTLAIFMEKVRAILGGHPITVNSAFRSEAVNDAVGGVYNSAHRLAYACDFTCPDFGSPYEIALALAKAHEDGKIDFDQLINEVTWCHISRDPQLREMLLTHPTAGGYIDGIEDAQ